MKGFFFFQALPLAYNSFIPQNFHLADAPLKFFFDMIHRCAIGFLIMLSTTSALTVKMNLNLSHKKHLAQTTEAVEQDQLYLQRGKTPLIGVLEMTLKNLMVRQQ